MKRPVRCLLVLSMLALALAAEAERAATEKRGFNAQGAFQLSGDVDAVALFTGNLVVTLPFGQYQVSPTLSYSLAAVYSSTAGWKPVTCPEGTSMPVPDENNTGGFKWAINLGQVARSGIYRKFTPAIRPRPRTACSTATTIRTCGSGITSRAARARAPRASPANV